jgi:hypothetical protein
MPSMADHESNAIVKALLLGNSGAGKTGALVSLIDAGLKVRVLDFDNGVSVLGRAKNKDFLRDNVHYVTLRDKMKLQASKIGIQKADAFQRAMDALDGGSKGAALWGKDFGPVTDWGSDCVLVVDTLALAGKASLQMVMQLNGKGFSQPELQHYGTAMDNIEKLLDIITSDAVGCHVIVNTHTATAEGSPIPVPEALGSKLGPKVGKFFDNMLSVSLTSGARTIKTVKDGLIVCKTAKPLKETYPLETGLADIFRDLTGKKELV